MPFPIEQQEQALWCWAAVSDSADHYFDTASTLKQCIVAKAVLGRDCCGNPPACNQAMKLQDALSSIGRLAKPPSSGPPSFNKLKNELNALRPVAVRIAWFGGGAHFVLICGFKVLRSGVTKLEIADPFYGDVVNGTYFGIWEIDSNLFPQAYQDGGNWDATYFLQAKSGDNP